MRARFNRWLVRPSTLNFLRQLIGEPCQRDAHARTIIRSQQRSNASTFMSMVTGYTEGGKKDERQLPQLADERHARNPLNAHAEVDTNRTHDSKWSDLLRNQGDTAKAWATVLEQEQRLHGDAGIRRVWLEMRKRHFDLPVLGELADRLWEPFISFAAAKDQLSEILSYAHSLQAREKIQYPRLYSCVVGHLLVLSPSQAVKWHNRLRDAGFMPTDAMKQIFAMVTRSTEMSTAEESFRSFQTLYRKSGERNLYDHAIGMLLADKADDAVALQWHRLFITHGDAPSSSCFARSDVQHLFELDNDKSLPMVTRPSARTPAEKIQQTVAWPKLTRANMSMLVGEVHGIKPKTISDTFIANIFATRAFPLEATLGGVGFLGIDKIGPIALRELATRAGTPAIFRDSLATLAKGGIHVTDDVFCRLLCKLATEDNGHAFSFLLRSDQHHESYEDAAMQEKLLIAQLKMNDWPSTQITLAVLELVGQEANARAWNRLMQHYISRGDLPKIVQTMQQIQSNGLPLTLETCVSLNKNLLPERQRGRRPSVESSNFDPYEFVAQALMYAQDRGLELKGKWTWAYSITNQGLRGHFDSVQKMILKLAESRLRARDTFDHASNVVKRHWTDGYLSNPELHGQLVVWGFRQVATARTKNGRDKRTRLWLSRLREFLNPTGPAPWARGLALLRTLNKVYDIPVSIDAMRHAFLSRMITLFGPGSSEKPLNNEARRKNRQSLAHYIRQVNTLWPDMFPEIPADLLQDDAPKNHPHLLRAVFGPTWRVSKKREQFLDVDAWTKHLLDTKQYIARPVSHLQRIPFSYYDDTALTENNIRWRTEFEKVLELSNKPAAYGRWAQARREATGPARSFREKRKLEEESEASENVCEVAEETRTVSSQKM